MRTFLAVIAGFMTIAFVVAVTSVVAYSAMGSETVFKPGLYSPSGIWIATRFVLGFAAAIVGGLICATLARDSGGPNLLAAAVLILGVVLAGFVLMNRVDLPPRVRSGEVPALQAIRYGERPAWAAFMSPFIGVAGVLLGARFRRR